MTAWSSHAWRPRRSSRADPRPGATIVAPPYYALLTGTRLPRDAADTYIVAQRARRGDPAMVSWARRVAAGVSARRYPVVLTDLRLAEIAPLMAALHAHYWPIYGDSLPPALHVVVWAPAPPRGRSVASPGYAVKGCPGSSGAGARRGPAPALCPRP